MYYMAVMDCYDELHDMFGDNKYGRVEIHAYMTSDDNQFSYEDQGSVSVDMFLTLAFVSLFGLYCYDFNKFVINFETRNSPHFYCLIAMGF